MKYMKTVIFNDEFRVTLDRPDDWVKGWAFHGTSQPTSLRRWSNAMG